MAPILPTILKPKRNISRKRISKEVEVVRTSSRKPKNKELVELGTSSRKPKNKEFVEDKMITFS